MSSKLTELINRSAELSPEERLKLAAYLKPSPDEKSLTEWGSISDQIEQKETIEHRSIAAKYAGSLEFTDDEFAAMLQELEEDK